MINTKRDDVISLFKKYKPKALKTIQGKRMGLSLREIGSGVFREVYEIKGTKLVVKIPRGKAGIKHSQDEYKAQQAILKDKKYEILHKYMPEILYYDAVKGIIVMPQYTIIDNCGYRSKQYKMAQSLAFLMFDLLKVVWHNNKGSMDMHEGNIGLNEDGEPILLDMGYLYGANNV